MKDRNRRADRLANRRMEQAKIRRDRYGDDVQQHQRQKRSKAATDRAVVYCINHLEFA